MQIKYLTGLLIIFLSVTGKAQVADTVITDKYIADSVRIASFKEKPKNFLGKILYNLTPERLKYNYTDTNLYKQQKDTIYIPIDSSALNSFKHPESNQGLLFKSLSVNSFDLSEQEWTEKNNIVFIEPMETNDSLTKTIYGFHPFWMGDAYRSYSYSLLSRIAYFSFDINSNSQTLKIPRGWQETEIIKRAHQKNTKVDITISSFGKQNTADFLNNQNFQSEIIKAAINQVIDKGANGINLNIEDVAVNDIFNYTNFIKEFSEQLKEKDSSFFFSVCVPAIDWSGVYLPEEINQSVDLYIVMGYDFNGNRSLVAGPNAPLHGNSEVNIANSLYTWFDKGLPRKKTLLSVPYFGYKWNTENAMIPSQVVEFTGSLRFNEIAFQYKEKYKSFYDSIQSANYLIFNENNKWNQIWYDDVESLSDKYNFVKKEGLSGIGIWALGYDNGLPAYWNQLKKSFTIDRGKIIAAAQTSKDSVFSGFVNELKPGSELKQKLPKFKPVEITEIEKREVNSLIKLISILILILSFFAVFGFIIALFDYNVREVLFSVNFRVIIFFVLIFILVQIILRIFDVLDDKDVLFIIGIGIGITITFVTARSIKTNMKNPKDLTP